MMPIALQETATVNQSAAPRVLIADDQPDVLEALRLLLKSHWYEIETASSPAAILSALDSRKFDLVLMDLNYARDTTSGREGIDILDGIRERDAAVSIVVMTGWGSVGLAVEVMQHGVGDFVEKPWVNTRLLEILERQSMLSRERREAQRLLQQGKLRQLEAEQKVRRQEREMEEALRIQRGFLPAEIPQAAGYEIAAAWQPARVVGGDYYDVLRLDVDTLAFCIADVAGKGVPAALLMSNLQAAVRGLASRPLEPGAICEEINRMMCGNIADDRFITFFYGSLSISSGRLRYCNAGHPGPMLLRGDGGEEKLGEGGAVLGIIPGEKYVGGEIQMRAGDRLICFTDGVAEAHDADENEFGDAGVLRSARAQHGSDAAGLVRGLLSGVAQFAGDELEDDATLLVIVAKENFNSGLGRLDS
jgi:phosphoserine phosphatase RsbU/P